MNQSVKIAISQVEPSTKAAQLRKVMPDIEEKLAGGVQLSAIHKALVAAGFDLTFQTLKTYLYRYRKKERPARQANDIAQGTNAIHDSKQPIRSESALRTPVSMQEIDRLMKPDPAEQAEKLARYERLAKQQRRSPA